MNLFPALLALLAAAATPALSQSVGLLIGNEDYSRMSDVGRGTTLAGAERGLTGAGMQVVARREADLDAMQAALAEFGQMATRAETILVVLGGRFVASPTETYFLPTDAEIGPLAALPGASLPLSTVLAWLSARPGKAVLVLSTDQMATEFGPLLRAGIGTPAIPQGVTLLSGEPRRAAKFVAEVLTQPGRPFVGMARQHGLTVAGFAPDTLVLIDAPATRPETQDDRLADIRDWREASRQNTAASYQGYIDSHPDGEFVRMAENRLASLTDTPEARAEREEQALDLSRDARRDIQQDLTLVGFNTRGIDGIFGRGTRAAVAAWQQDQGFAATGFLNRDQITRLDAQAERRAAELEAEAEARRQEQLAADLAFWDETGAHGDEAGLRAYLNRYPDGEFAEVAQERLDAIALDKRGQASRFDRQIWDLATSRDSIDGYNAYLDEAPDGMFRDEARARIAALEEAERNAAASSAAARGEEALNLSPRTRQIVESRLNGLGLKPGRVDGVFDDDTRRAIRRYQAARNLDETGYLSEAVVVQLMADSVRQIFR